MYVAKRGAPWCELKYHKAQMGALNNGDGALNSVTDRTADWRTRIIMDGPGRAWTATGLSWKGTVTNKTSVAWTALA